MKYILTIFCSDLVREDRALSSESGIIDPDEVDWDKIGTQIKILPSYARKQWSVLIILFESYYQVRIIRK